MFPTGFPCTTICFEPDYGLAVPLRTGDLPVLASQQKDLPERDRLRSLVADYCVEHGVAELTLRRVGQTIGSNNRLLLYYFDSKEGLILAALQEANRRFPQLEGVFAALEKADRPLLDRLLAAWRSISAEPNMPYLRLFFEVFGLAVQNPARFGEFLSRVGREWSERVADVLRAEGIPSGDARLRMPDTSRLSHGRARLIHKRANISV